MAGTTDERRGPGRPPSPPAFGAAAAAGGTTANSDGSRCTDDGGGGGASASASASASAAAASSAAAEPAETRRGKIVWTAGGGFGFGGPGAATAAASEAEFVGALVYESPSTRVYRSELVPGSGAGTAAAGTTVAVKCLRSPSAPPSDVSALGNELRLLSGPLGECRGARRAVGGARVDGGLDAAVLEWVDGVDLGEWIESHPPRVDLGRDDALRRIGIARAVAKAVADVHGAGFLHGDVAADNVIISEAGGNGGSDPGGCTAKLIDFGFASPLSLSEVADEGERASDDLYSLGLVLRDMFTLDGAESLKLFRGPVGGGAGQQDCSCGSLGSLSRGRGGRSARGGGGPFRGGAAPTRGSITSFATTDSLGLCAAASNYDVAMPRNLPHSVEFMLTNLMGLADLSPYASAAELEDDLTQMLDDPDAFLFDPPPEDEGRIGRLGCCGGGGGAPPRRLHGREGEAGALLDAYRRALDPEGGPAGAVLVYGRAGTGKSALVRRLREPVAEGGGFFISGKFDQMRRAEPYSAFVLAFDELCELILARDEGTIRSVRGDIIESVGSQGGVLTSLIPRLVDVIGPQPSVARADGNEARNRLNHAFRMLVRAVSSPDRPLFLFLDDLQWADAASLELLGALATDLGGSCSLLVGCYRDDEVTPSHPLSAQIWAVEGSGVPLTRIEVGDLDATGVRGMVSEALRLLRRLTGGLAAIVHRKTRGNAFFVGRFLRSLGEGGLLSYSWELMRWTWDEDEVGASDVCDNVVGLMTEKIRGLPADVRRVATAAAAVGARFDRPTLESVLGGDVDVMGALRTLRGEDLVVPLRGDGSAHKFSHDRIQQAAYSLVPEGERGALHLAIGESHLRGAGGTVAFAAVDQMNRGRAALGDGPEGRARLSGLNLEAGRRAAASSAFLPAAGYLRTGIELLGERAWDGERYGLSLGLFTALAEAEYCNGNFEETEGLVERVFERGRTFDDKFPAYMSLIKSAGARGKTMEALTVCLDMLAQLGESLPGKPTKMAIARDLIRTKLMVRGKSDESLSMLAEMGDVSKIRAMRVLSLMFAYAYLVRQEYVPLVAFRMMRISLRHGACRETAFAYALYGLILSGVLGDVGGGYRFGTLSLTLLDRFDAREWFAHVYALAYYGIRHRRDHLSSTLEPLLRGYQVGLEAGDNEYSMHCAYDFCSHSFQVGQSLKPLEEDMRAYCRQMTEYKQDTVRALTVPFWQCALNLMRISDNPVVLTGEAMDQERLVQESTEAGHDLVLATIYTNRLMLAYLFGDYELAGEMGEKSENAAAVAPGLYLVCFQAFYHGLALVALAREGGKKKGGRRRRRRAVKLTKTVRGWARHSPENCRHKALLMEAELLSLRNRNAGAAARRAYDGAISAANRSGFAHEEALAYERAGRFYVGLGEQDVASRHFARAHHLYLEWGAAAKSHALNTDYPTMVAPARRRSSFDSFLRQCGAARASLGPVQMKESSKHGVAHNFQGASVGDDRTSVGNVSSSV